MPTARSLAARFRLRSQSFSKPPARILPPSIFSSGASWESSTSEVYLYFDLADGSRVIHLMGEPQETRHLVVAEKQAALLPAWSVHSGAGTADYTFCWGMGGENQDFMDMDATGLNELL